MFDIPNRPTEAELKRVKDAKAEQAFRLWMTRPETKLVLSLIPESQSHEAVQTALHSAFEAGRNYGGGEIGSMFIEAILKPRPRFD